MDGSRSIHSSMGGRRSRLVVALLVLGVLLILMLAAGPAALAGPREIIFDLFATPSWTQTVAGTGAGSDYGSDVVVQGTGATFLGGELVNAAGNEDISLTKYQGDVLKWTKVYDGPGHGNDTLTKMALSPDGKAIYLAGAVLGTSGHADMVVIKRSTKNGNQIWAKRFNGPAHGDDIALAIGVDGAGNVVIGGYSWNATDLDWTVVSYKASGAKRWSWQYAGSGGTTDLLYDLIVMSDGTTYMGGFSVSPAIVTGVAGKLKSTGGKAWLKKYAGPAGLGAAFVTMTPRPGGGVYAAGMCTSAGTGMDGLIVRYSGKGARTVFAVDSGAGGATGQMFNDVAVTSTKYVVGVGRNDASGTDDCHLMAYRPDGSVFVSSTVAGAWDDEWTRVVTDEFGGFCAVGTYRAAAADKRIALLRGSTLTGGGGFASLWTSAISDATEADGVAIRSTTVYVAGTALTAGPSLLDQVLLAYTY